MVQGEEAPTETARAEAETGKSEGEGEEEQPTGCPTATVLETGQALPMDYTDIGSEKKR